MLIRLSADQTNFFELSGADIFLVLLFQLVLVPLVALVALVLVVLAPLVLVVLEPFPFDVDYYYRSVLEGCHIFRASDRDDKLFISHGENTEVSAASTTLKSSEAYRKLIKNTNHVKYGRDAYLCEKWGGGCAENARDFLNSNKAFKAIFRRKNENHEILYYDDNSFVSFSEHMFKYPFNRTNVHISWWDNDKRAQMSIKSPRCINKQYAPSEFVWKLEDQKLFEKH